MKRLPDESARRHGGPTTSRTGAESRRVRQLVDHRLLDVLRRCRDRGVAVSRARLHRASRPDVLHLARRLGTSRSMSRPIDVVLCLDVAVPSLLMLSVIIDRVGGQGVDVQARRRVAAFLTRGRTSGTKALILGAQPGHLDLHRAHLDEHLLHVGVLGGGSPAACIRNVVLLQLSWPRRTCWSRGRHLHRTHALKSCDCAARAARHQSSSSSDCTAGDRADRLTSELPTHPHDPAEPHVRRVEPRLDAVVLDLEVQLLGTQRAHHLAHAPRGAMSVHSCSTTAACDRRPRHNVTARPACLNHPSTATPTTSSSHRR